MGDRILLGMSGGVDSTYAVIELRRRGFSVEGAVLKMSDNTDVFAAQKAAEALGVRLHIVDCTDCFRRFVIENFISEYAHARTPNPCVVCNRFVKIAKLCELAGALDIPYVATGHYAGVRKDPETGRYYIIKAADKRKDQSYVLGRLTQEQLSMLYFPLFEIPKTEIRSQALQMRLPSAEMPESQEICFIPNDDYTSYIEAAIGAFPKGKFVDEDGNVLGEHEGIIHYTIGQRKGLGISLGHPVFVSAIDATSHTVTLSAEDAVFSDRLVCGSLNFMHLSPGNYNGIRADVKIRYSAHPEPATVRISGDWAEVIFDRPVRAVTPGQFAVFYQEDGISFAGVIDSSQ